MDPVIECILARVGSKSYSFCVGARKTPKTEISDKPESIGKTTGADHHEPILQTL